MSPARRDAYIETRIAIMSQSRHHQIMNWRHIPLFIGVTIATYIVHEGAHWLTGEAFGYDLWVNINSAGLMSGTYRQAWHGHLISAAGPMFTLAQGIIAFVCVRRYKNVFAFIVLFAALMMRFVAMLMSFSNPNDEARISEWLGLGTWTLHLIVVGILFALTIKAGRYLKFRWRDYGLAYVATSLGITLVVMGEGLIPNINL